MLQINIGFITPCSKCLTGKIRYKVSKQGRHYLQHLTLQKHSLLKCPSIFNWFASLFISGKLLLNLMIQFKACINRKIFFIIFSFSSMSFWLTERFFISATSGRAKSHDKLNFKRNNFCFSQCYILVHPWCYLLISLRTLAANIVKVLWSCCPSPLPRCCNCLKRSTASPFFT